MVQDDVLLDRVNEVRVADMRETRDGTPKVLNYFEVAERRISSRFD
jgi:hypothetical protein